MSNKLSQISCDITSMFKGDQRDQRQSGATIDLQFSNGGEGINVGIPIESFQDLHDVNSYAVTVHSNIQNEPSLSGQYLNPIQMDTIKEMVSAVEQFASRAPDSKHMEE